MPRLFTGLEIPAEIGAVLATFRGGLHGARWIDPDDYHITLRFIGDVDYSTAREIHSTLDQVHKRPIAVALDSLGSFGGSKPRAVYARAVPTPELTELQADLERRARRAGLPPETRKFVPHVTLARLRDASPIEVAGYLAMQGAFRTLRFTADRFALFSSRDSVGGGPYVTEAAYALESRPISAAVGSLRPV
jgi:2'-5' RNA ligase